MHPACSMCTGETWVVLQDCGHPSYIGNYLAFYFAIKAHHLHMKLIANCDLGDAAPTEVYDWHMYTSADDLFARRNDFDQSVAGQGPQVFASEYAVQVGAGWGNLKVRRSTQARAALSLICRSNCSACSILSLLHSVHLAGFSLPSACCPDVQSFNEALLSAPS